MRQQATCVYLQSEMTEASPPVRLPWLLQSVQAAFGKPVHNVKYLTTSYDHARQRHALSAAARPTEIDRKACRPRLWPLPVDRLAEIGRASCRDRVCPYV